MSALPAPWPWALPPAVLGVVRQGEPATGRYEGRIGRLEWDALDELRRRPAWWPRLRHKRWQYLGLGGDDVFLGLAIVDLGWACTAFAYAFDRASGQLLADWSQDGLRGCSGALSPEPVDGAWARFRGPGAHLRWQHEAATDAIDLQVRVPGLSVQARILLQRSQAFLLAVGPVEGGAAHATQKSPALAVEGWAEAGGRRHDLACTTASLDSSHGLLPHDTRWRWASAHRPGLGFNLQAGYFGDQENALWLHDRLIPLGAARFEFDPAQPLQPWRVSTDDGLLDLVFRPEGARAARRHLGLVSSRYVQPVGTFHGTVRASPGGRPVAVSDLLGVTEDHHSRW